MFVRGILDEKGCDVATIAPAATLADAAAALRDHGIGALVVTSDGHTIGGIISERDVVRALAAHGMAALGRSVSSAMTTAVATCRAEDTVDGLLQLMTDRRIRHLPVVDESGRLAGIVSIGDMVKRRLQVLEDENRTLVGYIQTG